MRLDQLVMRSFAQREADGTWFAICIDLNIYARGDTFEEARSKLDKFIFDYIHEAVGVDRHYVADLIPRRAPLYFRAKYYFYGIVSEVLNKLLHHFPKNPDHRPFKHPLPLAPTACP